MKVTGNGLVVRDTIDDVDAGQHSGVSLFSCDKQVQSMTAYVSWLMDVLFKSVCIKEINESSGI